jgi:hypothetical protein
MDETYVYGWESWMAEIVVYDYIYIRRRYLSPRVMDQRSITRTQPDRARPGTPSSQPSRTPPSSHSSCAPPAPEPRPIYHPREPTRTPAPLLSHFANDWAPSFALLSYFVKEWPCSIKNGWSLKISEKWLGTVARRMTEFIKNDWTL